MILILILRFNESIDRVANDFSRKRLKVTLSLTLGRHLMESCSINLINQSCHIVVLLNVFKTFTIHFEFENSLSVALRCAIYYIRFLDTFCPFNHYFLMNPIPCISKKVTNLHLI